MEIVMVINSNNSNNGRQTKSNSIIIPKPWQMLKLIHSSNLQQEMGNQDRYTDQSLRILIIKIKCNNSNSNNNSSNNSNNNST